MASRNKAVQHDPVVVKMLAEHNLTYDQWEKDTLWAAFREVFDNPKSPMRKQIMEVAEQKIKDEFIQSTLES